MKTNWLRAWFGLLMLAAIAEIFFGLATIRAEGRHRRQRDELAWRTIYLLTNADPSKRKALETQLNRTVNDIEREEGDDTLFDWKNDPQLSDRPMDLGISKEKR